MDSIKVPDIKTGDRFWHNGELYTARSDAQVIGAGTWYRVHTDSGTLDLHCRGTVLQAGSEER